MFNPGHGSRFLRGYLFSERQRHGLRLLPTGPEVHKSQLHKPAESRDEDGDVESSSERRRCRHVV